MAEHRVHSIQVWLGLMADVELRATGVAASVGHGQRAGLVLLAVDLAIDLITGAAGSGHTAGTLTAVGAATLGHETRDHTVEGQTVIEAVLGQLHEVGHGVGRIGFEQLQFDRAGVGHHHGFGHSGVAKIKIQYGRSGRRVGGATDPWLPPPA